MEGDVIKERYPDPVGALEGKSMCENYWSDFDWKVGESIYTKSSLPNSGFILVEIYYDYNMILGLPWITAFLSEDPPGSGKYPITLHAYSFMPNRNVEPSPASP